MRRAVHLRRWRPGCWSYGSEVARENVTRGRLSAKSLSEMPGDAQRTDGELLTAVVSGDGQAFSTFYRRHLPTVVAYLLRETRDREATADLTAEVFAAVFLVARRFRARGAGSARPWVLGIARNKLLESRRRGRVDFRARGRLGFEPELLDDDDLARVDELAAAADQPALKLVERLPERQRE